jgi:hypothetical protein
MAPVIDEFPSDEILYSQVPNSPTFGPTSINHFVAQPDVLV